MARGQLLPIALFFIVMAIVWRMPEAALHELARGMLTPPFPLIGWVVATILAVGWAWHAKKVRRFHSSEYKRISDEKNRLQGLLNNKDFESSDEC